MDELDDLLRKEFVGNFFVSNVIENNIVINTDIENNQGFINYVSEITNLNKKVVIVNRLENLPRKENGKVNYAELLDKNEKMILQKGKL